MFLCANGWRLCVVFCQGFYCSSVHSECITGNNCSARLWHHNIIAPSDCICSALYCTKYVNARSVSHFFVYMIIIICNTMLLLANSELSPHPDAVCPAISELLFPGIKKPVYGFGNGLRLWSILCVPPTCIDLTNMLACPRRYIRTTITAHVKRI